MATVAELRLELQEAEFQLRYAKAVSWGSVNAGGINYLHRLQRCHQLQRRIQIAEREGQG